MTKVISLLNHKGGVGKTTTAANLGIALGKKNKVLLIDLDSQANLTNHLGFFPDNKNIYNALRGECGLPIVNYKKNIDLVCSHIDLSAADMEFITAVGREFLIQNLVEPYLKNYDYLILDCAPSLGLMTINALAISNIVIIPVELSAFALSGMAKLIEIINLFKERVNKQLKGFYILPARTDFRKTVHKDVYEEIKMLFPENTLHTFIRSNVKIEESQINRTDIFEYEENSNGAIDYMRLANEIMNLK